MELMRYKDFVWPRNPKRLRLTQQRELSELRLLGGGSVVQDLGRSRRVAQGEGELCGDAYWSEWEALSRLYQQEGTGLLTLPGCAPFFARFASLELVEEPFFHLIRYSFAFWEDGAAAPAAATPEAGAAYHTTAPEETLWSIAAAYRTTVDRLLACNPDVRRPDQLEPGRAVRLP